LILPLLFVIIGVVETQKGTKKLSSSAGATSEILYYLNDLFDSFNGIKGQGLTSKIHENSGHVHFLQEACQKLIKMRFVEKESRKILRKNAPKYLTNWIWTIRGTIKIWDILQ
jgi:hypothetical protein